MAAPRKGTRLGTRPSPSRVGLSDHDAASGLAGGARSRHGPASGKHIPVRRLTGASRSPNGSVGHHWCGRQTGVPHDSEDYGYTCHLADCRSYGGFSGSPCFLEIPFASLTEKCLPPWLPAASGPVGRITYTHVLCGMFTEHLDSEDPMNAVSRLGVGIMLRAPDIVRAIDMVRSSS